LPKDSSQAIRGLVYIAANCYAAIGIVDYPERYCTNPSDDERKHIIAGTRKRLHYLWDLFADTFPAQPYLSGERLGALDLLATVVSKWSGSRQHLAKSRPAFSALLHKVESYPRIAAIFARHWPG
jgi:GST-like protein